MNIKLCIILLLLFSISYADGFTEFNLEKPISNDSVNARDLSVGIDTVENYLDMVAWGGEGYFRINLIGKTHTCKIENTPSENLGNIENFCYIREDGNFKWDIYVKEKPLDNKLEFNMEAYNVTFYKHATQQQVYDFGLSSFYVPDSVENSYEVYLTNKKHNFTYRNTGVREVYKINKVTHIYRPFLIDAVKDTYWVDLELDKNIFRLQIPDGVKYPILIDPTFGKTDAGASSYTDNFTVADTVNTLTATTGDSVIALWLYVRNQGLNHGIACYDMTSNLPNNRVIYPGFHATSHGSAIWESWDDTLELTNGSEYTTASCVETYGYANCWRYGSVVTAGSVQYNNAGDAYTLNNPWGATTNTFNLIFSQYGEYVSAGGSPPIETRVLNITIKHSRKKR